MLASLALWYSCTRSSSAFSLRLVSAASSAAPGSFRIFSCSGSFRSLLLATTKSEQALVRAFASAYAASTAAIVSCTFSGDSSRLPASTCFDASKTLALPSSAASTSPSSSFINACLSSSRSFRFFSSSSRFSSALWRCSSSCSMRFLASCTAFSHSSFSACCWLPRFEASCSNAASISCCKPSRFSCVATRTFWMTLLTAIAAFCSMARFSACSLFRLASSCISSLAFSIFLFCSSIFSCCSSRFRCCSSSAFLFMSSIFLRCSWSFLWCSSFCLRAISSFWRRASASALSFASCACRASSCFLRWNSRCSSCLRWNSSKRLRFASSWRLRCSSSARRFSSASRCACSCGSCQLLLPPPPLPD
mmetsp:Transcript_68822/g.222410  ORF Transcript_68822/g.222410 Transcript_68822/m.222410 type:complete len:364 (+) Transcript_68822:1720-2811(+)